MLRLLWLALFACALPVAASVAQESPARGNLLLSVGELADPHFARTVVLVLHHDVNGSLGLIVNRPTWVAPVRAFPELAFLSGYRGHVFVGGPVAPGSLAVLVRGGDGALPGGTAVLGDVRFSTDPDVLRGVLEVAKDEGQLRIYAGHAAWQAGQLEEEIAAGRWRVVAGRPEHVFTPEPLELWEQMSAAEPELLVRGARKPNAVDALRVLR